jgi:hypothetical protein
MQSPVDRRNNSPLVRKEFLDVLQARDPCFLTALQFVSFLPFEAAGIAFGK